MTPVTSWYNTVGGHLVVVFSVMLTDEDIASIGFHNWQTRFKAIDLILYMQNKGVKLCKVHVHPQLLVAKEMPVDTGPVYRIRQGTNDSNGKPVFWLDYEAVVNNPSSVIMKGEICQ